MIIITRSNGIYSSPRIEKYINYYDANNYDYQVVGWDRKHENLIRKNTIYYQQQSGYNTGALSAVINRIKWMSFLFMFFIKRRRQIKTIHACDLDTAFPACLFKFLFARKAVVIFDVCDWFSATLSNQNFIILWVFKIMEKFSINHSDEIIICEPERIKQIPYKLKKKELILPNIPLLSSLSFLEKKKEYQFKDDKIVVSYVGGFFPHRCMELLFQMARNNVINLLIAGYGDSSIEKECKDLGQLSNVKYYGKVLYEDGLNIMYNSDLIFAMYSKLNPNHFYAAPNKFYESMALGKAIISTKGINLESKILSNNIGFAIEENLHDFNLMLESTDRSELEIMGSNAKKIWEEQYSNYTSNFMANIYSKKIII